MSSVKPEVMESYRVLLTDKAARVIREAFEAERVDPQNSFVRVGAHPGGCSGYKYDLDFADGASLQATDAVFESQGIRLVVDRACLSDVLGSVEIDYVDKNMVEQGFKFRQLDAGAQCGCGESFQPMKARASN